MNKNFIFITLLFFLTIKAHFPRVIEKQVTISAQSTHSALAHLGQHTRAHEIPQVTIWIHATKFLSLLGDYLHATPRSGLIHISEFSWTYRLKSLLETVSKADPLSYPIEHMYAFGWSGSLSFEDRKKESHHLYASIKELIGAYQKKYTVMPHITLITHSHGGNVVLNLAHIKEQNIPFKVNAIFLGCPVQHATKHFIHDEIFEKIYSFYSAQDWIQAGDPQGFYVHETNSNIHWELSDRVFPFDKKLMQTHIKINGSGIWHLGYIRHYFMAILPQLIKEIDQWETESPHLAYHERILSVKV
jgi:hypothetical protein